MNFSKQLIHTQQKFSAWRSSAAGRTRVTPKALREEAARLLMGHTVEQVSEALHVPLSTLKTWKYNLEKNDFPSFIELPITEAVSSTQEPSLECNLILPEKLSLSVKFTCPQQLVHFILALMKEK